ncbi:DOMON-like domain-containing protein [Phenylobacterium sp.]|uniref:DOMON-like domain-containing protein n=1 Tax=Phenylobacterium sp. TaxID=1871053 RepID=UPI00271CC501|nr:DOMON-like domain-containing protein [Phenylobacterium sp.]MDO8802255.1 DOMON-like domain-containing protein [Phenylobacterium sp.]
MRLALERHRDSQGATAATGIEVEITWPAPGVLALTYVVSGDIAALALPPAAPAARTDELWRHTCLEAFVGEGGEAGYYEFNLAPSGQWAAYRFHGYRQDMEVAGGAGDPRIHSASTPDRHTLTATLTLAGLPGLSPDAAWRLALSAVIEQIDGQKSYWALAHPSGRADFHHADGFSQFLTPAERA